MKRLTTLGVCYLFLLLTSVEAVHAEDETFDKQFVGSPLLILVAIMIIAALASLYNKIRK